jgi:methylated-DNA-[protein]-cysteine S-methyltransferase
MPKIIYHSPLGPLLIEETGGAITALGLSDEKKDLETSPLLEKAIQELDEYFQGKRQDFDLPVRFQGTEFQDLVWRELRKIPYGKTRTYGEIASLIGREKAVRAVGGACNRNALMLLVPCHRVLGSNGKLTGFACGLDKKAFLLDLEKQNRD